MSGLGNCNLLGRRNRKHPHLVAKHRPGSCGELPKLTKRTTVLTSLHIGAAAPSARDLQSISALVQVSRKWGGGLSSDKRLTMWSGRFHPETFHPGAHWLLLPIPNHRSRHKSITKMAADDQRYQNQCFLTESSPIVKNIVFRSSSGKQGICPYRAPSGAKKTTLFQIILIYLFSLARSGFFDASLTGF